VILFWFSKKGSNSIRNDEALPKKPKFESQKKSTKVRAKTKIRSKKEYSFGWKNILVLSSKKKAGGRPNQKN